MKETEPVISDAFNTFKTRKKVSNFFKYVLRSVYKPLFLKPVPAEM